MFTRSTFYGLSVRSFSSSIGWNHQSSQLTVDLVLDPTNGDAVNATPASLGQPGYFSFYDFKFYGLLQKFEHTNSEGGFTYQAVLTDPREVLEGAKVIIGGYTGSVGTLKNLFNAYGYWEDTGFGNSLVNEGGMPWNLIRDALNAMCNLPAYGAYGGPLTYRGYAYSLDLSEMPALPNYYRVSGGFNIGLLELISRVCDDAGCDFYVELVGLQIKIRTVSRKNPPPLGTISALSTEGYGKNLVRSSAGFESRNEPTSSFLIGGEVTTLYQTSTLMSFWGHDPVGDPILGTPDRFDFIDTKYAAKLQASIGPSNTVLTLTMVGPAWPDPPFYFKIDNEVFQATSSVIIIGNDATLNIKRGMFGSTAVGHFVNAFANLQYGAANCEFMTLNASPIVDVLGTTNYDCTSLELRLAKVNYESWAAFILAYRPGIASTIGMTNPVQNLGGQRRVLAPDMVNDKAAQVKLMTLAAVQGDLHVREMKVYEFVRAYANTYMGQKYAVGIPFVLHKQDPDTLKVSASYEITDGGYLPEASAPLGLSLLNEDIFKNTDGRFRCFVSYNALPIAGVPIDTSHVSPQGTVFENNTFYLEAHADPFIIYTPAPAAVVTVREPVFEKAIDTVGDFSLIRAVMQLPEAEAKKVFAKAPFGTLGIKIHPKHRDPIMVALPLKSNVLTYGPWSVAGAPGKVTLEHDPSLNPWTYGGFAQMNLAANARVNDSITNMQVSEAGTLELEGPPTASLGDILKAGGPNITNIDVSFGDKVTTSYRFQTYTPRIPGLFTKIQADRIKTLSHTASELGRAFRSSARETLGQTNTSNSANQARFFLQNAPQAFRQESPHEVFVATSVFEPSGGGLMPPLDPGPYAFENSGTTRVGVSSATYKEALVLTQADDPGGYQSTAVMSFNGLIRPFATSSGQWMSSYVEPTLDCTLNVGNLNPWKGPNDVEVYAYGSEYQGLHALRRAEDSPHETARPVSLRGPLVMTGWGYDWAGNPVPSGSGPGGFAPRHLLHSEQWKTGPVDMLWDQRRGVWTSHDVLKGKAKGTIRNGDTADMVVYLNGSGTNWNLRVNNWFPGSVASGANVYALYNAVDNKWYALPESSPSPYLIVNHAGTGLYNSNSYMFSNDTIVANIPGTAFVLNQVVYLGEKILFQTDPRASNWAEGGIWICENDGFTFNASGDYTARLIRDPGFDPTVELTAPGYGANGALICSLAGYEGTSVWYYLVANSAFPSGNATEFHQTPWTQIAPGFASLMFATNATPVQHKDFNTIWYNDLGYPGGMFERRGSIRDTGGVFPSDAFSWGKGFYYGPSGFVNNNLLDIAGRPGLIEHFSPTRFYYPCQAADGTGVYTGYTGYANASGLLHIINGVVVGVS